jgi:putative tricarboxylic transport membrane protein
MVDPVGPRAFPAILALLMALFSLYLIIKPDPNPLWPAADTWVRIGLITLTFIGYAYLMVPIGFVLATTLEMTALALIFQGPLLKSVAGSLVFSLMLYGLFAVVLELSLPLGQVFRGWLG